MERRGKLEREIWSRLRHLNQLSRSHLYFDNGAYGFKGLISGANGKP